jgi:hypothetical protein
VALAAQQPELLVRLILVAVVVVDIPESVLPVVPVLLLSVPLLVDQPPV